MNESNDVVVTEAAHTPSPQPSRSPRRGAAQWRELIEQQASSGLSIAAFCRERGLPPSNFYQWRRRLRVSQASPASAAAGFVRLEARGDDPLAETGPIMIRFGAQVTLHCGVSDLNSVIGALMRGLNAC